MSLLAPGCRGPHLSCSQPEIHIDPAICKAAAVVFLLSSFSFSPLPSPLLNNQLTPACCIHSTPPRNTGSAVNLPPSPGAEQFTSSTLDFHASLKEKEASVPATGYNSHATLQYPGMRELWLCWVSRLEHGRIMPDTLPCYAALALPFYLVLLTLRLWSLASLFSEAELQELHVPSTFPPCSPPSFVLNHY